VVVDHDAEWPKVFESPEDARRYAARKREVAHLLRTDRHTYVEAKRGIIAEFLARARA
jgi:hypothetical protein